MNVGVLRARWLLSALLLAAAALFAIGVSAERNNEDHHDEPATAVESGEAGDHDEAAEAGERAEAGEEGAHAEETAAERAEQGDEEQVLGVNLESVPLVIAAVIASTVLAVAVWFRTDRWLLWTVAGFAAVFTVFDVAELVHQFDENQTSIAIIVACVGVLHAAATVVAGFRARTESVVS